MITPSFGLTATERVLPRLALDWTTGVAQSGVDVTRAGTATFVGSNGLIQSATADTQRIDYTTGVAGLLVEESRTNLFYFSEAFDDPIWGKGSGLVITPNDTTAPDGTLTADLADGTGSTNFLNQIIALTLGTTYTISCYVKSAGLGKDTFRFFADTSQNSATFTATNEWVRYTFTFTSALTGNRNNGITRDASNNPLGIYVWGAQLEAGASPTSYIPTTSAAVTRNADVATMTGTNFSDWYNQTEGAFVSEYTKLFAADSHVFAVSDGTLSNRIGVRVGTTSAALMFTGGAAQANIALVPSSITGALYKTGFAYKVDNFQAATNTSLGTQDTSAAIPTVSSLDIGHVAGVSTLNGRIQKLMYYPQRIIDAELQAFTK